MLVGTELGLKVGRALGAFVGLPGVLLGLPVGGEEEGRLVGGSEGLVGFEDGALEEGWLVGTLVGCDVGLL